jgi:competence ComEA-like helix-hairpin-helix protein
MMSEEHDELIEKQEELPEPVSDIDLNTATVKELSQLPGIGPVLAARIVNYRVEVRPFQEPMEITAVPGIAEKIYTGIADRLTVGPEEEIEAEVEVEAEPEAELEIEVEVEAEPEPEPADVEELPPAEPEPIRVEEIPTPRPIPAPRAARGVGGGLLLVIGLASAVAGAILALLALLLINGTLDFRTETVKELRVETIRLGEEISRLDADMGQQQRRLEALQGLSGQVEETQATVGQLHENLSAARAEMESMAQAMGAIRQEFTNLREDLDGMAGLMSILGRRMDETEHRLDLLSRDLEEISGTVGRFDAFLEGLRHLLNESMGPFTPTPWKTPTPTPWKTPTPESMVTVIPLATPTPTP